MLKSAILQLIKRENLSASHVSDAMHEMIAIDNDPQAAAFMSLLRAKGETAEEIFGIVTSMREAMIKVHTPYPVLDIVGTGGDGFHTVNISTASALLAASCGVRVVKHGNRSVSSLCGSADVLESLGINITLSPEEVANSVEINNFGFCFAPNFHPALHKLKKIRNKLSIPSTFNFIGPLLNPANAQFLMIGVADKKMMETIADVLLMLKIKRALVFHCSGLDEICCVGQIDVIEIHHSSKNTYKLDPTSFGLSQCSIQDLQGGSACLNAEILLDVLKGKSNAIADSIILNAGVANYLYGISSSIEDGINLAKIKLSDKSVYQLVLNLGKKNKLEEILSKKAKEVSDLKNNFFSTDKLRNRKSLKDALSSPGISIISEVKRKSPSNGLLKKSCDPISLVEEYFKGGCAAVSVLTDQQYFSGSVADLKSIAELLKNRPTPVIRKDFIIDKSQIIESLINGADAILLIVAVLKEKTKEFLELTTSLGLQALVEVYNSEELQIALESGADIIAVNNRNLKTFNVDINISLNLIKYIPSNIIKVSASGIHTTDDIKRIKDAGFDAVLIGEALMKSDDPSTLIAEMRGVI